MALVNALPRPELEITRRDMERSVVTNTAIPTGHSSVREGSSTIQNEGPQVKPNRFDKDALGLGSDISRFVSLDPTARTIRTGGFSDVYVGFYKKKKVALKRPRLDPRDYDSDSLRVRCAFFGRVITKGETFRQSDRRLRSVNNYRSIATF